MNRKDFMQLISAGFSDPKLLSKATSDYYTRCKQRLLAKIETISKAIENDTGPQGADQYVSLQRISDGQNSACFVSVNDIANAALDGIHNASNSEDYSNIVVEVYDHYSDKTVSMKLGDIFTQLGEASDSLTIAIEAFSALASEVMSTASDFTNRVGILIPNMTEQTMQVCNDVYQMISSSESNVSQLYELVNDYFGIKQNMNRKETDPFELGDPAIEQYTGVNPTVALLSGLDWLGPFKWWAAIQKFQVDVIVGVGKWIWKGLASIGKWFVKSVDTTFVNPVDVETTGDTYEYFSNYSSILYDFSSPNDEGSLPSRLLMKNLDSFFTDDGGSPRPIWFNFKTITYHVTYQYLPGSPAGLNDNKVLVFNRYIKPTNINKFTELLTTAGLDLTSDSLSIDWIAFARELQNTDLACSKEASEKEIAASLVLTNLIDRWLTHIFDITTPYHAFDDRNGVNPGRCASLMSEYMNEEITGQYIPHDIITWIKKYSGLNVAPISYGQLGIWYTDYDTEFSSDHSSITTAGPQTQILDKILNDHITNKDMLQLVCNFAVRSQWDNVHAHVASPFSGSAAWNVSSPSNVMNKGCAGTELGFAILLTHLFLSEDIELVVNYGMQDAEHYYHPNFPELYDGVYLAYSRGALNIKQNSNVKTDQDNQNAARNWMITAIVIVAAIAASIYIGVKVTSLLKTVRLRQAQIDSNMFKIGEMISNGAAPEEVNALYNSTASLMKKNRLLGRLFGTTGYSLNAMLSQSVSDVSLPSTTVNTNLDPVLKLIKK